MKRPYLYTLDASGAPVPTEDVLVWADWYEAHDADRQVALTKVPDGWGKGARVSTVFLGIDSGFGLSQEAILWETMIFGGRHHLTSRRYRSRADALIGHDQMVEVARVTERRA